ncbi:MAG TPA: hypothetical protein VL356_13880 [Acidocella sp.]|jgi:excisionase family DNA binding protein|nr:hypothetical protein [Acidocella sp.]
MPGPKPTHVEAVVAPPAYISKRYSVSIALIYKWLKAGQIRSTKAGTKRLIEIASVEEFLGLRDAA